MAELSIIDLERFMSYVHVDDQGCWLWIGHLNADGYGRFKYKYRSREAHRVSYENFKGDIKHTIDHLCRKRNCVNPEHLEDVPFRVNVLRGNNPAALNSRMTHCKNGHELSGDNLYTYKNHRRCRTCMRDYHKNRYSEGKE